MKHSSRKVWARRVAAWQKSGKTAPEYASRLGVHPQTLYGWKYKLAREETAEDGPRAAAVPVTFVEVLPSSALLPPQAEPFELHLVDGHRVIVPAHFDPESLRRLLAVMEQGA